MISSVERTLVYDCESNGLLDQVTIMWCIVAQDLLTEEVFLFHDYPKYDGMAVEDDKGVIHHIPTRSGTLKQGVFFLHKAKSLICHNQLGYDQFLLKKFYPKFKIRYTYPEIRDTLLESQVQWYDRKRVKGMKGNHGLAPWGERVGAPKQEIEDWSYIDEYKLHRCIVDVDINAKVARRLEKERSQCYTNCNKVDFLPGLKREHEYRFNSTIMELNGAPVDKPHMRACTKELDGLLEVLRVEIEPQLPPTIKVKAVRAEMHDVAIMLGVKTPIERKQQTRKVNGELKSMPVKSVYRPSMKYTKAIKGKVFEVVYDGNLLDTPEFTKIADARAWVKNREGTDKPKGFKYPSYETVVEVYDENAKKHFGDILGNGTELIGPHTKIKIEASTMSQHEKVKMLLVSLGWRPLEWTFETNDLKQDIKATSSGTVLWPEKSYKGIQVEAEYRERDKIPKTPKLTEESYATIPPGLGEKIAQYNTYSHRRKFIENPNDRSKGLLNNIRLDGRITCGLMTFGTTAGRASQFGWVNAPGVKALYGKQIRNIIKASPGHTLVGVDMPSAHPRLLADFTMNDTLMKAVDGKEEDQGGNYVGEDIHTVNSMLFNLNSQADVELAREDQDHDLIEQLTLARGNSKAPYYACLYGGSGKKIGTILNISARAGNVLKKQFLEGLGLDILIEDVKITWQAQQRGSGSYMKLPIGDGVVWCGSEHKIINYLALGSEAIMQKVAVNIACREIRAEGLSTKLIMNIHDEVLFEAPDEELNEIRDIASSMYSKAALEMGLTMDWTSVAKTGQTYAKCH